MLQQIINIPGFCERIVVRDSKVFLYLCTRNANYCDGFISTTTPYIHGPQPIIDEINRRVASYGQRNNVTGETVVSNKVNHIPISDRYTFSIHKKFEIEKFDNICRTINYTNLILLFT